MTIQSTTDLSEDQKKQRYSRFKKSLPKLAAASLATALAVYFSYSSSSWRYVPVVVFASAAVLLIVSAVIEHSVKKEESSERMRRIKRELISLRSLEEQSFEHVHLIGEEITRSLEREKSYDFHKINEEITRSLREHNNIFREQDFISRLYIEQIVVRNIRELSFVSRIDGQIHMVHETELHRLASRKPMSNLDITRMKEILSSNMRTDMYKVDHNWNTPLHNAMQSENLPAIKLLLEHGDCLTQKSDTILLKSFILRNLLSKRDKTLYELFTIRGEKIREQKYSYNIDTLLSIPQIRSRLCNNPSSFQKVPNCEGVCSTLKELSVEKVLGSLNVDKIFDSCRLGG